MKRLVSILTTASLMLSICASGFTTSAQQSSADQNPFAAPRKDFLKKMHPSARIGSTPERKAAWDKLAPEQQAKVQEKLRDIINKAKEKAEKEHKAKKRVESDTTLSFTDKKGKRKLVKSKEREVSGSSVEAQRCFDCEPIDPCPGCEPCYDCYPTNQPPQVSISALPTSGTVPLAVNFTANAYDPDGYITNYYWNFGDGQTASGASVSHTYQSAGNFTASVTVTDDYGDAASASIVIRPTNVTQPPSGTDADGDGLPESFENALADAFTPFYHVSAGEPNGFAIFNNSVPQTVQQVFAPIPPISYFRVKPLGFSTDAYGNQLSVIQLDYLTLWDRDNGLAIGFFCEANLSLALGLAGYSFSQILPALTDHALDNERSAVLVAAPVPSYNTYNTDPQAYSAYRFFTAAHEDTFTDQSHLFSPSQPVPAGNHIELALSRSKHATYPFNPDYLPLVPDYIIYSTYATINFLYYNYYISDYEYFAYLYAADSGYYACAVDRFAEQGGTYAGTRINVGEVSNPINNSNFIRDTELSNKLSKTF